MLAEFLLTLQTQLNARDFATTKEMMTSRFLLGTHPIERDTLAAAAAIGGLSSRYMPYDEPEIAISAENILSFLADSFTPTDIFGDELEITAVVLSSGWGMAGTGQALLYITAVDGDYAWAGLIASGDDFTTTPVPDVIAPPPGLIYQQGQDWFRVNEAGETEHLLTHSGPLSLNPSGTLAVYAESGDHYLTLLHLGNGESETIEFDGSLLHGSEEMPWLDEHTAVLIIDLQGTGITQGSTGNLSALNVRNGSLVGFPPQLSVYAHPSVTPDGGLLYESDDGPHLWRNGTDQPLDFSRTLSFLGSESEIGYLGGPVMSPDGRYVAGVSMGEYGRYTFAYVLTDLTTATTTLIHPFLPTPTDAVMPWNIRWSPDSQWVTLDPPPWNLVESSVQLVSMARLGNNMILGADTSDPLWLDSRRLVFKTTIYGQSHWHHIDIQTGEQFRLDLPAGVQVVHYAPPVQAQFDCRQVSQIPPDECAALVALYHNTKGDLWQERTNWLVTEQPCDWVGVGCENGHVTTLELHNNQLKGHLPAALGSLTQLKRLVLSFNEITGPVPPELGQLQQLQILDIHGLWQNGLSGPIPSELGQLTSLQTLNLCCNKLSGSIPPTLGQLTNLKTLDLFYNQLNGSIPAELGALRYLEYLALSGNQLSGPIPLTITELTQLTTLDLGGNQLSGTIPTGIGNLTHLQSLSLAANKLEGPIPTEIGKLTELQELNLNHNRLTGPIPAEFGYLVNLNWFDLAHNQLSGTLPPQLGQLIKVSEVGLNNNPLAGPVPAELTAWSNLWAITLTHTQLCLPTDITFTSYWSDLPLCDD